MSRPADEAKNGLIARTLAVASRPSARFSLGALAISGGIAAMLFWVGYPPSAATQPVIPGGDDLRAVYATAEEVAEGKRLAEASCAGCHGANGISSTPGVPHLAAQRPAYGDKG
jgi:mono/diheme cytochrome c family protein